MALPGPLPAILVALPLLVAAAGPGAAGGRSPDGGEVPRSLRGAAAGELLLQLSDAATGRAIFSAQLREGDRAVLTWTNSLFRLLVTEVFVAHGGVLELTSVTYADPSGREPPRVRPQDVDDLYHTGGPFHAEGLARPIRRVVFRVGEVGHPTLRVGDREVRFLDEVGFGGAVVLQVE